MWQQISTEYHHFHALHSSQRGCDIFPNITKIKSEQKFLKFRQCLRSRYFLSEISVNLFYNDLLKDNSLFSKIFHIVNYIVFVLLTLVAIRQIDMHWHAGKSLSSIFHNNTPSERSH